MHQIKIKKKRWFLKNGSFFAILNLFKIYYEISIKIFDLFMSE